MKKELLLLAVLALLLNGCKSAPAGAGSGRVLQVAVTTAQAYEFAEAIGGGHSALTLVVVEDETVQAYDLLLCASDETEAWGTQTLADADGNLPVAHFSIALSNLSKGQVLTSPYAALMMVQEICTAYCKVDPTHAAAYQVNADIYAAALWNLHTELAAIAAAQVRPLIFTGDFLHEPLVHTYGFSYFAAGDAPTPAMLSLLIDEIRTQELAFVLSCTQGDSAAAALSAATGAEIVLLPSGFAAVDPACTAQTYIAYMEEVVACIKKASG